MAGKIFMWLFFCSVFFTLVGNIFIGLFFLLWQNLCGVLLFVCLFLFHFLTRGGRGELKDNLCHAEFRSWCCYISLPLSYVVSLKSTWSTGLDPETSSWVVSPSSSNPPLAPKALFQYFWRAPHLWILENHKLQIVNYKSGEPQIAPTSGQFAASWGDRWERPLVLHSRLQQVPEYLFFYLYWRSYL